MNDTFLIDSNKNLVNNFLAYKSEPIEFTLQSDGSLKATTSINLMNISGLQDCGSDYNGKNVPTFTNELNVPSTIVMYSSVNLQSKRYIPYTFNQLNITAQQQIGMTLNVSEINSYTYSWVGHASNHYNYIMSFNPYRTARFKLQVGIPVFDKLTYWQAGNVELHRYDTDNRTLIPYEESDVDNYIIEMYW